MSNIKPLSKIVAESLWQPRLNTIVLSAFATVTLEFALAGIQGRITQMVGDRTAEIDIRMEMGHDSLSDICIQLSDNRRIGTAPIGRL